MRQRLGNGPLEDGVVALARGRRKRRIELDARERRRATRAQCFSVYTLGAAQIEHAPERLRQQRDLRVMLQPAVGGAALTREPESCHSDLTVNATLSS